MSGSSEKKEPVRFGAGGGRGLTGETARDTGITIRRLFAYARPYRGRLLIVSLLVVVNTISALAGPILLAKAIDDSIGNGDLASLLQTALVMLMAYLLGGAAAIAYGVMMVSIAQRLVAELRAELFTHLQSLSMSYHQRHRTGDLMSRVTNDTEAINRVLSNGLIEFITNVLQLGGILIAMFLLNWRLAIATLILLPLML